MRYSLFVPLVMPLVALFVMGRAPASASREVRRDDSARALRDTEDDRVDGSRKDARVAPGEPSTTAFEVTFFHTHTLELLPVAAAAMPGNETISHFLRCRVTGAEHEIAEPLFPLATRMATHFHASRVDIVSGYRSSKLNELLRKKEHQVANDSQHTHGTALDFRIPGVDARALAAQVSSVHVGGIGTYTENNFVHADVGRARRWNGR